MFPNSSSSVVCMEEAKDIFRTSDTLLKKQRLAAVSLKHTHLAKLLINNPKLEVVADHMLIKGSNEPGCLRTREQDVLSQVHGNVVLVDRSREHFIWE